MASKTTSSETLDSEGPPNKRLKTQSQSEPSPISPSSKGKTPIADLRDEAPDADDGRHSLHEDPQPPRTCGICLSDEGTSVRGCIDCCDHYYCFVCIIEWSKVESRCPLCKCRFRRIRRMRRDGSFISDRAVEVPIRDQIYDPFGDMSTEDTDPYARIKCSVCRGTADESLLILCDLCDTAVHTYCIGLGATVPEGDWYCDDCVVVQAEQYDDEISSTCSHIDGVPRAEAWVSVFDIVTEPRQAGNRETKRLLALVAPRRMELSSNVGEGGTVTKASLDSRVAVMESDVRTLSRCRNVHKHIRALRQNWASFQRGTLCFGSNMSDCDGRSSMQADALNADGSSDLVSLPSSSSRKENTACNKDQRGYDVNKAWKMLNIAKSMQQDKKQNGTVHATCKTPGSKLRSSKDSNNCNLHHIASKTLPSKCKDLEATGIEMHLLLEKTIGWSKCQGPEKERHDNRIVDRAVAPKYGDLLLSRNLQNSCIAGIGCDQARTVSYGERSRISSQVCNGFDESPCSSAPMEPITRVPYNHPKLLRNSLTSSSVECPGAVVVEDKTCAEVNPRKDCGTKSEIQSLVKLNLKMLTRGKHIEVDAFKDIARRSTHEILAACGLQHQVTGKSPIIPSICSHKEPNKQPRMSTLMPSSCRECFYVYVMDVVNSALSEKLGRC
ncbi:hypothetical protein Dimus_033208 [Dionaea muscipula]